MNNQSNIIFKNKWLVLLILLLILAIILIFLFKIQNKLINKRKENFQTDDFSGTYAIKSANYNHRYMEDNKSNSLVHAYYKAGKNIDTANKWILTKQPDGYYTIRSCLTGRYLKKGPGINIYKNTRTYEKKNNDNDNDKWLITKNDNNYKMKNKSNGEFLAIFLSINRAVTCIIDKAYGTEFWKLEEPEISSCTTKPSTTQPSTTKPSTTKPSTTQPSTTKPSTTQPSTTKPSTTSPQTTSPETTSPQTTLPSTTSPQTTSSQTTSPSTTSPQTTSPSTTQPTTTQPSTTSPSTTSPSTTQPNVYVSPMEEKGYNGKSVYISNMDGITSTFLPSIEL